MQRKNLAYHTFLVRDLDFTTPCWSATLSLLHLNQFFFWGGGKAPLAPLNTPMLSSNINCSFHRRMNHNTQVFNFLSQK